jgi:hypothetical protein
VADFDGDGRTDLAFTNGLFNRLYIYRSELGGAVTATADGLWYLHLCAADGLGGVGPTTTIPVRFDTRRPATAAWPASVSRGQVATLRCAVHDAQPCAGWARVTVQVLDRHSDVVRFLKYARVPLGPFSPTFRCTLARGTYRYRVGATDAAANHAKPAWGTLVVR